MAARLKAWALGDGWSQQAAGFALGLAVLYGLDALDQWRANRRDR